MVYQIINLESVPQFTLQNHLIHIPKCFLNLLKQLEQFHNFKRQFEDKHAYEYKDKMMEYAKKHVPLTKYKPTPQDS